MVHRTIRLLSLLALAGAAAMAQPFCPWESGSNVELSADAFDRNMTTWIHAGEVRQGERIIVRGEFPHARFLSLTVYDQSGRAVDSLIDRDLLEIRGWNPFLAGMDRRKPYLGDFEVDVRMSRAPAGKRPANTLYAIGSSVGPGEARANRRFFLVYRVLLLDTMLPGSAPPKLTYRDAENRSYCPVSETSGVDRPASSASGIEQPANDAAENPPKWSRKIPDMSQSTIPHIAIAAAQFSARFGQVVQLTFPGLNVPRDIERGGSFQEKADLRYWSITLHSSSGKTPAVERTLADFEVPTSPDEPTLVFIGLGGASRPKTIGASQWLATDSPSASVVVRYVLPATSDIQSWLPQASYLRTTVVGKLP